MQDGHEPESATIGASMVAAFIVSHAVHAKAGAPSGLTEAGKASKAAKEALS